MLSTIQVLLCLLLSHAVHCESELRLDEFDTARDAELSAADGDLKAESRYSFVTSSIFDWLKGLGLVNYNSINYYLTMPNKAAYNNLFLNQTGDVFPIGYTLAGAALVAYVGAYFLGQIPGGALLGRSDPEYDEDGLGLGFARDNEDVVFDEFGQPVEDYDYQYPDSFYSLSPSGSEFSQRRVNRKEGGKPRPPRRPRRPPGMYEEYWKHRRSGRRRSGSGRAKDKAYRKEEGKEGAVADRRSGQAGPAWPGQPDSLTTAYDSQFGDQAAAAVGHQ